MSDTDQVTRLFTIDEANATLSVIRPDIEDLLGTFKEIRAEIEAAATEAGVPIHSADLPKRLEARGVAPKLFEKVRSIIGGIHARGCLVNGPEAGLVDFPCLYDKEIVFLCWKHGESRAPGRFGDRNGWSGSLTRAVSGGRPAKGCGVVDNPAAARQGV